MDQNWQGLDNFSWKLGWHEMKLGFEFRRTTVAQFFDSGYRGKINFDSLAGFLQGIPSGGGPRKIQFALKLMFPASEKELYFAAGDFERLREADTFPPPEPPGWYNSPHQSRGLKSRPPPLRRGGLQGG